MDTRIAQEQDITRLQKIKKWLKENLVGLSAVGISITGVITTIIMAGRKALVKGGQALGCFGKSVVNVLSYLKVTKKMLPKLEISLRPKIHLPSHLTQQRRQNTKIRC